MPNQCLSNSQFLNTNVSNLNYPFVIYVVCIPSYTWINESPLVVSDFATPWTIQSVEFSRPEWVAIAFSRRSSQSRNWTQVSHITSRFFSSWATREAQMKMWRLVLILLWKYFIPKFQISCFSYSSCSLITAPPTPRQPSPAPKNCFSNSDVVFTALLQAFIWFETGPAAQSKETWSRAGSREENYVPFKNRFTEHLVMSKGIITRISWGLLVLKPWRIAFWEEGTHRQILQLETRAFRQVLCSLWPSSAPQVAFIWRGKWEAGAYGIQYLFIFSGEGDSDSWGLWQQGRSFRCRVSTWTRVSWVVELVWSCVWAARPGTLAHLQLLWILFSSFAA